MGYFSNGTEGMIYEENYCMRCDHYDEGGCPVLTIHALYNYDQCRDGDKGKAVERILSEFIPIDGIHNGPCRMITEMVIS